MRFPSLQVLSVSIASQLLLAPLSLFAQQPDASPVDIAQLLQSLKTMKEQHAAQIKANKIKAISDVQSAAGSGPAAAAAWEEAVRQVQFNGAPRENVQFREWKQKDGEALEEKEAQNAARLYFNWLHITLQRSSGVPVKDLLASVIQHTKEVTADQVAMDAFSERLKHEKELAATNKRPAAKGKTKDEEEVKRMHDQIIKTGLAGSVPVQALKIGDFVNVTGWEQSPGNVEGIFQNVILPELRLEKDARVLEFWDMKIKREGEAAARTGLSFESDKFTQTRRPELLWKKAQDELLLGQKNRAITDMFTLIKSFPTHPSAGAWVTRLEQVLLPPAPGAAAPSDDAGAEPVTQ
ncbi:MAG: hypothetical protein JWL59_1476 [Chthoniobacteraceae bacterium]|nr:hypothetical protein [Chthoniobacteraceae bacterium]